MSNTMSTTISNTTFNNKTAVISGGGEGIGFHIARALGQQGMNIVLGDIDPEQLQRAVVLLEEEGINALGVQMDVTDPAQWQNLADQAIKRFDKIHMLVNNAGVGASMGPIETTDLKGWRWVLDVNLMGVVMGAQVIVPLIKQHQEGGWIINVASMAGLNPMPYGGPYTATKYAVVGLSRNWQQEFEPNNIHVSVLCPAFVKTRIHLAERNRPGDAFDDPSAASQESGADNGVGSAVEQGIPPEIVGKRVVEALEAGEFYILTHPEYADTCEESAKELREAYARAAESAVLPKSQGVSDLLT